MIPDDLGLRGKRVTVIGLGLEGVDLVRFAAACGAYVTVSDKRPANRLSAMIKKVADLPIEFSLGRNDPADIASAEVILVSQGVPLDLPGLVKARQLGTPISSMLKLFLELCPGPVVGITGSSGKTTTTSLLGEMFRAEGLHHFIGGNIGIGLLEHLPEIRSHTWVVLEISHTQLQMVERSPHVSCILNVTPNHLDRFSWDDYKNLKLNILRYQGPDDFAILSCDDQETLGMSEEVRGQRLSFSLSEEIPGDGVYVRDGWARWRRGQFDESLFPLDAVQLRGEHNRANAIAAATVACVCGLSPQAIVNGISSFRSVPHRLELVATVSGVNYYNDSIATTPERTLAGLRSFTQPLILLLGGRDKKLPLTELSREASQRCRAIIFFGEARTKLETAVAKASRKLPKSKRPHLEQRPTLAEAVKVATNLVQNDDAVLLSPACTSFDAYENFRERGEHFREIIQAFAKETEPSLR